MLQVMQDTSLISDPPASSSFADLLAALAASTPAREAGTAQDELADDIATLTYEQALRTHARYSAAGKADFSPAQTAMSRIISSQPDRTGKLRQSKPAQTTPLSPADQKNHKMASVTIRISSEENAQLRQRAAEAGVTVSAYLRSCVFEVEALRNQVKDVLSQIRSATAAPPPKPQEPRRSAWRTRLFQRRQGRPGEDEA